MYHSISKSESSDLYTVSKATFIRQLDWIRQQEFYIRPFLGPAVQEKKTEISFTFDDGYADNLTLAAPILLERNIPFSVFVAIDHIEKPGYLDRAGLKELSTLKGVSIGSHGKSHRPLSKLSMGEVKEELRTSRDILENITGKEVKTLSFPHGSYNKPIAALVRKAGFERAGTSYSNINTGEEFLAGRTAITVLDTDRIFIQKLFGAWDWYRWTQL
jgi:peptidoglycan/xylan/chitin deacetylase (PgdA/CDA1 family)